MLMCWYNNVLVHVCAIIILHENQKNSNLCMLTDQLKTRILYIYNLYPAVCN